MQLKANFSRYNKIDLPKINSYVRYKEFYIFMSSFGYCPIFRKPTRVTVQTKSLIDHLRTNEPHVILDIDIVSGDLYDFFSIFACIRMISIYSYNESFVSFPVKN